MIGLITDESLRDLKRRAVSQTPEKDHYLIPV